MGDADPTAYFAVYAGDSDSAVVRRLRRKFGHKAVDAYWTLLCSLIAEPGGKLSIATEDDWQDLGERLYGMDEDELGDFLKTLKDYGAIVVDSDQTIFSPRVSEGIYARQEAKKRSEQAKRAAESRWGKSSAKKLEIVPEEERERKRKDG